MPTRRVEQFFKVSCLADGLRSYRRGSRNPLYESLLFFAYVLTGLTVFGYVVGIARDSVATNVVLGNALLFGVYRRHKCRPTGARLYAIQL